MFFDNTFFVVRRHNTHNSPNLIDLRVHTTTTKVFTCEETNLPTRALNRLLGGRSSERDPTVTFNSSFGGGPEQPECS